MTTRPTPHLAVLTPEAKLLAEAFNDALSDGRPDAVGRAVVGFVGLLSQRLRSLDAHAETVPGTRWNRPVVFVAFPHFMELAIREVMDAIRGVEPVDHRALRIYEMTAILRGQA